MLSNLNTPHGFEVWVNQNLVNTIENEYKKYLKTEHLNYYYISCTCDSNDSVHDSKSEVKWIGTSNLIDFIKKVQKVNGHFSAIGVTNANNKKDLIDYLEHHLDEEKQKELTAWDYWIGDSTYQDMVCGDELFVVLWERIKSQQTKHAKTKQGYFRNKNTK